MSDRINVFGGLALERNAEQRDDAEFAHACATHPMARFLVLGAEGRSGRDVLIEAAANEVRWLDQAARCKFVPDLESIYLGDDPSGPLFALAADELSAQRVAQAFGGAFIDLRGAGVRLPAFQAGLFAYARAVAYWHSRTRYCGACGAPLEIGALGHRARCTNAACAADHFPRVDPAMIVIVSWRDRCLLGRQANWAENRWSTLAGFIEPGESLEDAVRREVFEESGVRVGACRYHSSQPWPFPSSLMIGFVAEAADPAIRIGRELSDARWFGVEEIVEGLAQRELVLPPKLSVSHELIAHWLREAAGLELAELLSDEPWQKAGT